MSAWVYRCYADDGDLLYVGATSDLTKRLDAHAARAWWAHPRVVSVRAKVYPTMRAALDVERAAIHDEHPRCNVMGRARDRTVWSRRDYLDYMLARSMAGSAYTAYVQTHFGRLRGEYLARFGEPMPDLAIPARKSA